MTVSVTSVGGFSTVGKLAGCASSIQQTPRNLIFTNNPPTFNLFYLHSATDRKVFSSSLKSTLEYDDCWVPGILEVKMGPSPGQGPDSFNKTPVMHIKLRASGHAQDAYSA